MKFPAAGLRGVTRTPPIAIYRIEGENVTVREIAKRLAMVESTARSRLSKLRNASGPVTWARLRA